MTRQRRGIEFTEADGASVSDGPRVTDTLDENRKMLCLSYSSQSIFRNSGVDGSGVLLRANPVF